MRLRSDPVTLLEGSPSAGVGVPGGEAAGGGQGLAPSTAQVILSRRRQVSGLPRESTDRVTDCVTDRMGSFPRCERSSAAVTLGVFISFFYSCRTYDIPRYVRGLFTHSSVVVVRIAPPGT